jgi:hypothetical protein
MTLHLVEPAAESGNWWQIVDCAMALAKDLNITKEEARRRIMRAVESGKLKTNGEHGLEKRIDYDSLSSFRLHQRDNAVRAVDENNDEEPDDLAARIAMVRRESMAKKRRTP